MNKVMFCSFSASGNEDAISYLRNRFSIFSRISIAFHHAKTASNTKISVYKEAREQYVRELPTLKIKHKKAIFAFLPLIYLLHLINVLRVRRVVSEKYDIFIGQNYFCAFCGILLRHLGAVEKTVYWIGDYYPIPPEGIYRYLLRIFVILDKYCIKNSDEVWYMTPNQVEVRKKEGIVPEGIMNRINHKIVPTGIDTENLISQELEDVELTTASFLGVLSKNQGLEEIISATSKIKEKVPEFKFKIIGSGPYENELKNLVKEKGLEKYITFYGYIPDERKVRELISKSAVAIALYYPDEFGFTQFADSGKVKIYLSCGVPVIVSDVPYIAEEVNKYKAGFKIKFDEKELLESLLKILTDKNFMKECKKNALKLAMKYSTTTIMDYALRELSPSSSGQKVKKGTLFNISPYDSRRIFTFYENAREVLEGKMPKPRMALIYPSRICNQNCYYCSDRWGNEKTSKIMPPEQFLALPKRLKDFGLESCELCGGGEPLIHPNIKEFIIECKKAGLKLASLTNGTMLKGALLDLIVENFSYIRVSIDSFDPDIYNRIRRPKTADVSLECVLSNLKKAVFLKRKTKSPIQIGLKICLDEKNILKIVETVKNAKELGVDSIQIKIARNTPQGEISPSLLEQGKKQLSFCKENITDIIVLGSLEKYVIDHKCWLSPCHIFIDVEGDLRLCCYYQFRRQRHTYGNIFKDSIENVWFSKEHFEAVKNIEIDECNKWDCKYFIYNKVMKEAITEDKSQWQFI